MSSDQTSIDNIISRAKKGDTGETGKGKPIHPNSKLAPGKIIDRLDDVTLQSEVEATKVVDLIDKASGSLDDICQITRELKQVLSADTHDNDKAFELLNKVDSMIKENQDTLFNAINLLQYQDVLRQKIEKIASALAIFYDYLGEFLGRGKQDIDERAAGRHVEEASLDRDQKIDEIEKIVNSAKNS